MTLHRPESLDAALSLLAEGGVPLGGGTDLYPALRDRPPPPSMIDLTRIEGLRGIARRAEGWRIGAATTWTDIARADLPPLFDGLRSAAREVGSVQIQNTATVAGNLCNASPAADGVPPLLTLDASIEVAGPGGLRVLPLSAFIRGPRAVDLKPGEMLSAILIPDSGGRGAFVKLGARRYLVISIAMAAATIEARDDRISCARVAVGACSPVARRLKGLEAALLGAGAAQVAAIVEAADLPELTPIDDVRAPAEYRLAAARTLIARAIRSAMDGEGAAR